VGEFGEVLTEDVVHALQLLDEPDVEPVQCCLLSAQATSGTESPACIRLSARVRDQAMLLLLDSGSSHSFVSSTFVQRLKLPTVPINSVSVKVANGQLVTCDSMVSSLQWTSQGHTFVTDLRVLPLDGYDAVLGMDWLEEHSNMNCKWKEKTVSFDHQGQWITLQGITSASVAAPEQMDFFMLQQLEDHNEIWAIAVLEQSPDTPPLSTLFPQIQILLTEFSDVFAELEGLPPSR
jgi:hypothetical protein